jgi:hypothetical protein
MKNVLGYPTQTVQYIGRAKKLLFCWYIESHGQKEQDPDPSQNVTDLENYEKCTRLPYAGSTVYRKSKKTVILLVY